MTIEVSTNICFYEGWECQSPVGLEVTIRVNGKRELMYFILLKIPYLHCKLTLEGYRCEVKGELNTKGFFSVTYSYRESLEC